MAVDGGVESFQMFSIYYWDRRIENLWRISHPAYEIAYFLPYLFVNVFGNLVRIVYLGNDEILVLFYT